MGILRRSFPALAVREFAILWSGSFLSFTAFFMSTVVQSIVAFELTGRNGAVGLVLLGQGLAQALLGPFGGALADRLSKRVVNLIGQAVIAGVFFVIGVLIAIDAISILFLVLGAFIVGVMFAFVGPSRQAWTVDLVSVDLRANAVALTQVALNASRVLAPAIGGALVAVAVIGAAGAYLLMGLFYLVVVATVAMLPDSRPDPSGRSVMGDMVAGLRYVAGHPRLRSMLSLFFFLIVLGLAAIAAVLPGHVERQLGQSVEAFGTLQAVSAAGGLLASLLVAPLAGSRHALALYSAMAVLMGLSLVLLGIAPSFALALVPIFLYGLGSGAFMTLNSAVIVMESEPQYYGRVSSLMMLAFAGFMLASFPVGLLADVIGEGNTLVLLGVVVVLVVAVFTPVIARAPAGRAAALRQAVEAD
jgi:MFS family permease